MTKFKVEIVRDLLDENAPHEVALVAPDGWRGYVAKYSSLALARAHAVRLRHALKPYEVGEPAAVEASVVAKKTKRVRPLADETSEPKGQTR